jgi:hypothetical protein
MTCIFDFDVAHDKFNLQQIERICKSHGVEIEEINMNGPGGGNPNIRVLMGYNKGDIFAFLVDIYGCESVQDCRAIDLDHLVERALRER